MKTNRIHSIVIMLLMIRVVGFAQSNPLDKKMEKAYKLTDKGQFKEADEYVEALLKEHPEYGTGWDYLCRIRYQEYKDSKKADNLLGGNIKVTTKDKDGKEVTGDTLATKLMELLSNISPSKIAYSKYKYTMRKATLLSDDALEASITLRNQYVDPEVDTAVCKKALKKFNEAEDEFSKKNYDEAAKLYKRAMEAQPDFYKASMYMGDCFYFMGDYPKAINSFKSAAEQYPHLVEPRKYLIDAYNKERLYGDALKEAIVAMTIYPDQSVIEKLEDAVYLNSKKMNFKLTRRAVFPNKITDSAKVDLNEYTNPNDSIVTQPWIFYQNALPLIKSYCDTKGIIVKPNSLTQTKYLEVFSWQEMLKNSSDPLLTEARKMQNEGYLDCYVMVSCFHFDLYEQYAYFVSQNYDKVLEYFHKYMADNK